MRKFLILFFVLFQVPCASTLSFGQVASTISRPAETKVEIGEFTAIIPVNLAMGVSTGKMTILISTKGGNYHPITSQKTIYKECGTCAPRPDNGKGFFCLRFGAGYVDSISRYTVRGTLVSTPKGSKGDLKTKFIGVKSIERNSQADSDHTGRYKVKLIIENP